MESITDQPQAPVLSAPPASVSPVLSTTQQCTLLSGVSGLQLTVVVAAKL